MNVYLMFVRFHAFVHISDLYFRLFPLQVGVSEHSLGYSKISDRFSRATVEPLDKGEITDGLRCEVVNAVCVPWYQMCDYPSKEEYTAVSKQLIQKYSVLKDITGNGYVSSYT